MTDPAAAAPVDWVLLCTKSHDTPSAAPWLARLCRPSTRVAVLQNGVDHVSRVSPLIAGATVVPAIVYYNGERLATDGPVMILGPLGRRATERFLDDEALRGRIAVLDLARLEKIAAVRSSVFVYFEWFLRDAYGVKILPENTFTSGLVERGIISLGMG